MAVYIILMPDLVSDEPGGNRITCQVSELNIQTAMHTGGKR